MSYELQFPEPEETSALLRDVTAFLDAYDSEGVATSLNILQRRDGGKKRWAKDHPGYYRQRREKKKAEREALRNLVSQYEAQLELLRVQKPMELKRRWVDAATMEEEKRRKAEDLNHHLKSVLRHQLKTAQTLQSFISMESNLVQRVQSIMNGEAPCTVPTPTVSFFSLGDIAGYLKRVFKDLHATADYVFSSPLLLDARTSAALTSVSTVKQQDPIAGSCIELLFSTPLSCSYEAAVPLLWDMLLNRQTFGPEADCEVKMKYLTLNSAEFGFSVNFGALDKSEALNGVTLMGKFENSESALFVWTSLLVEPNGHPALSSQGWISIQRSLSERETVVQTCSRLSGKHFGMPGGSVDMDLPLAKRHQVKVKSRIERVEQIILDRAELQSLVGK
ncbi:hypothetical protein DVH05_000602 [Phytophthora capsici]|nr:hypothetical protein DVH05_000602 [Phytophthora capsici]